jgi:hypothetical protein
MPEVNVVAMIYRVQNWFQNFWFQRKDDYYVPPVMLFLLL